MFSLLLVNKFCARITITEPTHTYIHTIVYIKNGTAHLVQILLSTLHCTLQIHNGNIMQFIFISAKNSFVHFLFCSLYRILDHTSIASSCFAPKEHILLFCSSSKSHSIRHYGMMCGNPMNVAHFLISNRYVRVRWIH